MSLLSRVSERLTKKRTKEELDEHYKNVKLEKGDFLAMLIAAVITFFPVVIVAMIVIYGTLWLLMR